MKKIIGLLLLCSTAAFAAISYNALWEVRADATAINVNGGGFSPDFVGGGFVSDLTTDANTANTASPVLQSATFNFTSTDLGNWVYISSGTSFYPRCFYQITSVASNKATVNATAGQAMCFQGAEIVASTTTGVASVGTPTGGSFAIDYSQSTGPILAATDLASTNATTNPCVVSSAGQPFTRKHLGNILHIRAGTSWTFGWYEIRSVDGSGNATLDRACGSVASITAGTGNTGGAHSLGSATAGISDDGFFENGTPGSRFFVRYSTFSNTMTAVALSAAGNINQRIKIIGYKTLRSDRPTGLDMPFINLGSNANTLGTYWDMENVFMYGTNATMLTTGSNTKIFNCKLQNRATATGSNAISVSGQSSSIYDSDLSSYRGTPLLLGNAVTYAFGNYIHSASTCVSQGNSQPIHLIGNIFTGCKTSVLNMNVANTSNVHIMGNTMYGSPNGPFYNDYMGIRITTGTSTEMIMNNNFVYLSTAIAEVRPTLQTVWPSTSSPVTVMYNNFYGNGVNFTTGVYVGPTNIYVDPGMTGVRFSSGTTATTSGPTLTDTTANFSTVIDSMTTVYIRSGTGITPGWYGVVGHTTTSLTLDIAPGTSGVADKVWEMTIGNNYSVGTNLRATGNPGVFASTQTVSYLDIGAVQRQETTSTSGGTKGFTFFQ